MHFKTIEYNNQLYQELVYYNVTNSFLFQIKNDYIYFFKNNFSFDKFYNLSEISFYEVLFSLKFNELYHSEEKLKHLIEKYRISDGYHKFIEIKIPFKDSIHLYCLIKNGIITGFFNDKKKLLKIELLEKILTRYYEFDLIDMIKRCYYEKHYY